MQSRVPSTSFLLLCSSLLTALAQNGNINFNNNFVPSGSSTKAFLTDSSGHPLPRGTWQVEVVDTLGNVLKSVPLAVDGLFFMGVINVPGTVPGDSTVVTLRGWLKSSGSSYDTASWRAQQRIQLRNLGGGATPPPSLETAGDFVGAVFDWRRPPWDGPPVVVFPLEPSESGLVYTADLLPGGWKWRLYTSPDLVNWSPSGSAQLGGYGRRWSLPLPETTVFFRVLQEPQAP